jgi:CBS domain containing-hemolysin-like protein
VALLTVYIVLAIGVSFLCSIMEAVLLSVTPAYVAVLQGSDDPAKQQTGQRLARLKADVDRPLAAILSLNTVAHTVGAAGAGAQAAIVFGDAALGVFSGVLTLGILLLSEIIPKTLGAVYWQGLSGPVTRLLRGTVLVVKWTGLLWLSQGLTRLIARGEKSPPVSRAELAAMAEVGVREGVFKEAEGRILHHLLRFEGLAAHDVMTPRTVLRAFPEKATLASINAGTLAFTRLPVYGGTLDEITGYVLRADVLVGVAEGRGDDPLASIRRPIPTVAKTLPLPRVFERMLERREHIALVVGEYGGTSGIVTMEDVIETLLGLEIVDEADTEQDMQRLARERWAARAERLGVLPEDAAERDAVIRLGLTGGPPAKG